MQRRHGYLPEAELRAVAARLDLPLYVSEPALAQDRSPGADRVGVRWTFSFAPAL